MLTHHAQTRIQQRGIRPGIVELIVDFGEETHLNGGVTLHSLGKKGMCRLRREYGDCLRISEFLDVRVVCKDGKALTVEHGFRRRRKT